MSPYWQTLAERIRRGLAALPERWRARHRAFLLAQADHGGGFRGRGGGADLYYTRFALRALEALDGIPGEVAAACVPWLRAEADGVGTVVEAFCLLDALDALKTPVASARTVLFSKTWRRPMRTLRAAVEESDEDARLYDLFLGACLSARLSASTLRRFSPRPPAPAKTAAVVLSRQCDDGGFADATGGGTSQTSITAAALGLLHASSRNEAKEACAEAAAYLRQRQTEGGGFVAAEDVMEPDLLSTFRALAALDAAGALRSARLAAAGRFLRAVELSEGGFAATPARDRPDAEYTYCGVAVAGLLGAAVET